jgi:hypothetical protein
MRDGNAADQRCCRRVGTRCDGRFPLPYPDASTTPGDSSLPGSAGCSKVRTAISRLPIAMDRSGYHPGVRGTAGVAPSSSFCRLHHTLRGPIAGGLHAGGKLHRDTMQAPPPQPGLSHQFDVTSRVFGHRVFTGDPLERDEPMVGFAAQFVQDERDRRGRDPKIRSGSSTLRLFLP